jgi:predicted enzyme related to lactoylglutathione lyase
MENKIQGIATVAYIVPDLTEAKTWYSKAFGTEPYFDEPFYVGFNINGFELGLQPEEGPRVAGNSVVAYWAVPDAGSAFDHFVANGAVEVEAPTEVGGGVIVASVKDPWGNLIGIIRNPLFDK